MGLFANFVLELGAIHEYKPHFEKTALSAISYLLRIHCMESLFDFKHLYLNIHNALSVFVFLFVEVANSILEPYHVTHATFILYVCSSKKCVDEYCISDDDFIAAPKK